MPVKYHKFNGIRYRIDTEPILGLCDPPSGQAERTLRIPMGLPLNDSGGRQGLITLIHESLHASNWDKNHSIVERTSEDIGKLLWRLGYRRIKK